MYTIMCMNFNKINKLINYILKRETICCFNGRL